MRRTLSSIACDLCGVTFSQHQGLLRHMRNIHKIKRNVVSPSSSTVNKQCPTCQKIFSKHSNLREHMRRHEPSLSSTVDRICSICQKTFFNRASLRRHMSVHENDTRQQLLCQNVLSVKEMKSDSNDNPEIDFQEISKDKQLPKTTSNAVVPDSILHEYLLKVVPCSEEYTYRIKSFTTNESSSLAESFAATFTVNLSTVEEFNKWLKIFQTKNSTQFNIIQNRKRKGKYVDFKIYLKCIHSVRSGKLSKGKNTGCPSRMTMTIRSMAKKPRRENRIKRDSVQRCAIELSWMHNHPLLSTDVLRRHTVPPEVDQKLIQLLRRGHSVRTALKCMELEIEESVDDDDPIAIERLRATRSVLPDNRHTEYIFQKKFRKEYGDSKNNDGLLGVIETVNEAAGETCVVYEQFQDLHLIAICMPFMKRVHQHIQESGELVFVDSSGGMDKGDYRVFLFMTRSKIGALPLAIGIAPCESTEHLTRLFSLIKTVIPSESFFNRGSVKGPMMFMTDDSAAKEAALSNVWPQSRSMLSHFHILQAEWRWLLVEDHGVNQRERPAMFEWVKKLLYAATETELEAQFQLFQLDPIVFENSNYRDHIIRLYMRREKWFTTTRVGELLRGNHTNNYFEASMLVLKDQIFGQTRAFNLVQMVDFLTERFSSYYERRLKDFAGSGLFRLSARYPKYEGEIITKVSDDVFEVTSSKELVTYIVNTATMICTCHVGETGQMCRHLHYVYTVGNTSSTRNDYTNDCRHLMYRVATGHEAPEGWLDNLHGGAPDHVPRAEFTEDIPENSCLTDEPVSDSVESAALSDVCFSKICEFTDLLKAKCSNIELANLHDVLDALNESILTLENLDTNSLVSALRMFGKYPL